MQKSIFLLLTLLVAVAIAQVSFSENSQPAIQRMNQMPLAFTKNMGQWDDRVLFRTNAGGATMWFTKEGVTYQFIRNIRRGTLHVPAGTRSVPLQETTLGAPPLAVGSNPLDRFNHDNDSIETLVLTAKFVGANPNPEVVGEGMMEYKCNYFLGNDPTKWHTDVPNYSAITLKEIYPGIDLKYSGDGNGQVAYEFIVAQGADIARIKVEYEGAEETSIDADSRLILKTKCGDMIAAIKSPPFGVLSGSASFSQSSKKTLGLEAPGANRQALGASSVGLVYSTYLGGSGEERALGIAVDGSGNAYVTGFTNSPDFPTTVGAYDQTYNGGGYDAFVAKFSSSGVLIYSTYLGGESIDYGYAIAVDGSGNAYVTGNTYSIYFPVQDPFQGSLTGGVFSDAFVTKLSASGNSLIYSTYIGGGDSEAGTGIAVDGSGSVYVTGYTDSDNFPCQNPYQATFQGGYYGDVFVTKLSSSGNSLLYSTYLGGGDSDLGWGIAVDGSGNAYVTGYTYSSNFPAQNPYQTYQGGWDAFVTKLSSSGNSLVYSTYFGGGGDDHGQGIAVDGSDNAYVTGWTQSSNFPTWNPYQTYQGSTGLFDAFVAKLSSAGNSLMYSTYLGGTGNDFGCAIAVDGSGNAHVTGSTQSSDFPILTPYQTYQGGMDAFVTKLSSPGNSLIYSTCLGASSDDYGYGGIAVDASGCVYVTGETSSSDFPTLNPYQPTNHGYYDAFVTKLRDGAVPPPVVFTDDFSVSPKPGWLNTQGSCSWNVTSGSWQTSATGQQFYCTKSVGDSTWRNYDYQVDVKGNSGVDKVVNFRLQDSTHWYGINLRSGTGPGEAGEILLTKRSDSGVPALLTSAPFANTTGVWYTIKVSCVDELLKVYVNNNAVLSYTDSADVYYSGGIGLTCYTGAYGSCDIAFDNVLVTDPYPHFDFDSLVVGEYVGDQIAISGKLTYRDGATYVPSSGQLTVEDPAQDILTICQVQANGAFVYSAPTAGTQEGLHMYVFACSTSTGVAREAYNVALREPAGTKSPNLVKPIWWLSREINLAAKNLKKNMPKATEFMAFKAANSAYQASGQVMGDGLNAIFGTLKADVTAGWKRTFDGGNPLVEGSRIELSKCDPLKPWTLGRCVLGTGGLVWAGLGVPWNTMVGKIDYGLDLARQANLIDNCTYQGAKSGVEAGDFVVGVYGLKSGKLKSFVKAVDEGSGFFGTLSLIENRFLDCLEPARDSNPYPTLGVNLTMPGFDVVMLGLYPKIDKAVVIRGYSPIEITVTDPLGRVVSPTVNQIPGAEYYEFDSDLDGDTEQVVIIPMDSGLGNVSVEVTPKAGADPNEIVSVIADYTYYQEPIIVVDSVPVSEIPSVPTVVPTFENLPPSAAALLTTADTTFAGFPCVLRWASATDPNPGHIVSYRVVVARQPNFADSVAVEVGQDTAYAFSGKLWNGKSSTDTTSYYWKVYAHDDWNASTASVDSRSFRVLYQCGDADGNGIVNISDVVYLIAYVFSGGPAPAPLLAGDVDCNGIVNISDVVYLIAYIFNGSPAPCAGCK